MPSKLEEAIRKRDEAILKLNKVTRELIEAEIRETESVAGRAAGSNRERGEAEHHKLPPGR